MLKLATSIHWDLSKVDIIGTTTAGKLLLTPKMGGRPDHVNATPLAGLYRKFDRSEISCYIGVSSWRLSVYFR